MLTDYILPLLNAFGGVAALLGLLVFLVKLITEHALTKSLEDHKRKLADESAKEIERVKSSLEKELLVHNVKFTGLHQKRAEVMEAVYAKIVIISGMAFQFIDPYLGPVESRIKQDDYHKYRSAVDGFMCYYLTNRIFLMKRTCVLIDAFRMFVESATKRYDMMIQRDPANLAEDRIKDMENFINVHHQKARDTLTALEDDMRKILGDE